MAADTITVEQQAKAPDPPRSLVHNRAFMTLWSGQSVSVFGTQISQFALPWLVLDLSTSAASIGILNAISFLPYLIFALPAGVIADRWNRKTIMLVCDAARGLIIASIPIAYFAGWLTLWQLFAVGALLRLFTIFFDVGYMACLPNLVEKPLLPDANGKLEMTRSAAELSGQPLAGALVTALTAAGTMVIDAFSYVISFISLLLIRTPFAAVRVQREEGTFWQRMGEGLRFVWQNRLVRALTVATLSGNLANGAVLAVLVYRARVELHFNAVETGIFMASTAIGQFLAAIVVGRMAKRFPLGRQIFLSALVQPIFPLIFALTGNIVLMTAAGILWGGAVTFLNVPMISLRQSVIPDHLLGRASATIRMFAWCMIPVGAIGGGFLASAVNASATLAAGAGIFLFAVIYMALSPIPRADRETA
jgi:MFS family permease